jgi:2-oxoglutarate dehydrogenase E1 component
VAVLRLEQIYPFPSAEIEDALAAYPAHAEVVWVQEEPKNMGAWRSVQEWMNPLLLPTRRSVKYVGRAESASPSAGSLKRHQQEQAEVIASAFAAEVGEEAGALHLVAR